MTWLYLAIPIAWLALFLIACRLVSLIDPEPDGDDSDEPDTDEFEPDHGGESELEQLRRLST